MGRHKCPKVEIVGSGEENIRTVKTKHMLQRLRGGEQEISGVAGEGGGRDSKEWKKKHEMEEKNKTEKAA